MGEYADERVEYMLDMSMNGPCYIEPDYEVWNQRDGTPIPVANMSKPHLYNTIAMLRRSNRADKDGYIKRMEAELRSRS